MVGVYYHCGQLRGRGVISGREESRYVGFWMRRFGTKEGEAWKGGWMDGPWRDMKSACQLLGGRGRAGGRILLPWSWMGARG